TIKENLSIALPDYMIPSAIVRLENMPITINGKIDKKALPTPHVEGSKNGVYEGPRNEREEKLIEIWEDILGVKKISINDNFFELGGHSLRATVLASKIHKEFSVGMPLSQIFKSPTIKALSAYIVTNAKGIYKSIDIAEEKDYYLLSSAQKRLYTLQQLEAGTTSYNIPNIVEIEGSIEEECLQKAFNKLLDRHETLRTSFEIVNDEPVQIIHDTVEAKVEIIEVEEKDIQETIKELIKPFELNKAPLIRVILIKVADGKALLMYDIHHLISDGISMKILVEEFMKLYSGNELPQLTRQYKDYSEWQNKLMESKELEKEKAYWMNVFKENIPVLNISSDYTRPAVKKYDGRDIEVELDIDVVKRLKKLSGDTGTTMYMILIAAFNVLLSKYSNQEDIVVGTPIAGRAHIDLEGIIGMFVNTLAMRNKPESEKTFLEFLNEVKYTALQAYENQNYQFEELVDHLEVVRDFSRNPIFDVMFAMQNFEKVEIEEKGLRVTPYNYENRVAKFDLTMTAMERDERIMVSINYCTSLFKKTTIIRMIEHYENILSRITEDENVQIKDIDMLSTNEREMVVETFNATHVEYNRNKTIQEIFEKQVEENHKKTALIYENREMTYEELNKRSNQLARKLREYGVTKDSIVGLMVERSFEMIVGIMAILKAGGAYLPIDPEYPQNRIEYILDNSETRMLLTQSWIREKVKYEHKVIELDDQEIYKGDSSNPVNINDGRDLAYVIYTSGSTGKPKGVLIEHHNVVNFMIGITDEIPFDENEKVLSLTTISFDIFVLELIVPLLKSMTVVIANDDEQKNIVSINNLIKERSIDILQLTPSRFSILNAIYKDGKCFEGIKELIIGGEEFPDQLYDLVEKGLIDCNIYNVYGPTETTVWSTILKVESSKELTIGKPLANTKIFIVDHNNLVQGIGMEGEICIAGEGVTRGYIRNSKLTEEKFPENSLGNNVRVYRTGDLGKWLPDGNIMYCGRKDQQHKINGYRIELTEIEKILELKTEIEKVVVNVSNDKDQKVICAYIVFKDRRIEVDVKEIRQFLIRELPHYMIPTYYFSISEVPLTPNGKVDLKSLPSIENQEQRNKQYVPPVSDVEIGLTKIWRNIFDNRQIGITDDFFEIGGNSLKLMKVVYNIRQQFNAEIPLVEAFRLTTIEELAEYINKSHRIEYKKINYNYNREFYPLSSAQKRMYILNQINEENTGYNLTAVLRLDGLYHIEYLEDALIRLVERHEALRTIFELVNGTVVQRIIDSSKVEPKIQRLEIIGSIENSIKQFIQPFDLGNAPLMRVGIVNESEKRGYLIIDMHHIISDGTTLSIISDEFIKLYKKDTLPEVHVEYKDYTLWQEQYRKTEEYKKQGDYWYDTLKDYNRCLLDTDYKRPEVMKYSGESVDYYTDEEVLGKLKKLALDSKTTLFMILLSAYNLLLYKYTGEKSIVVGTPISGRTRQEFESMVGLFVNTLALINHINVNETYLDFLLSVKNSTLQGYSNQDYQFDELVELLEIEPQKNSNPIFSTMFMLQNFVDEEVNEENGIEGVNITQVPYENPYVKLDIKFATQVVGNRLVLTVEYASELFKRETIDIFVQDYIKIIKKIIKNPRFLIKTIETKVDREIEDILSDFNDDLEGDY
ncbi:non-ribosomal peptide synthetase, partial [Vallitalea longa]|uniref:non-ribosomal peptide synthetase n=1 Tax=Vallitalea longa TaxID=2936439 RepID=UPI00249127DF